MYTNRQNLLAANCYARQHPESYAILCALRATLTSLYSSFPKTWCPEASHLVARLLPNTVICSGTFSIRRVPHYWIFDPDASYYIDVTAGQFGELEPITRITKAQQSRGKGIDGCLFIDVRRHPAALTELDYRCHWDWIEATQALMHMAEVAEDWLEGRTFKEIIDIAKNTARATYAGSHMRKKSLIVKLKVRTGKIGKVKVVRLKVGKKNMWDVLYAAGS